MAVTAGLAALGSEPPQGPAPHTVVVVTREPALLEGGSSAVLCAALGLTPDTQVVERLGGAAPALDAMATGPPGTLVIGVDVDGAAAAGALLVGAEPPLAIVGRVQRSLPVRTRLLDGRRFEDDDPRLVRERSTRASLDLASLPDKPAVIAGLAARDARPFCSGDPPVLPTTGASSPFFAVAAFSRSAGSGAVVAAMEQANLSAATIIGGIDVTAVASDPIDAPKLTRHPGGDIKIALTAYERAFEPKVRWEAGRCDACGMLAFPPRFRCLGCGSEDSWALTPLPRTAEVYTLATIHVPVPGLATPYTLAVVQLDGVAVRALVTVTDALPGSADIGTRGEMVLRRIAVRSGVPDYGYAFAPTPASAPTSASSLTPQDASS